MLGYRQCGERAVRVDILERLADLIRPALAWRESSPGEKPTGAFDGRGFVVTQAMTSLTGSAGEDFASILRALGYRMDRRPPLPPKPAPVEVVETVSAEAPPVEAAAETTSETPAEEVAAELPVFSTSMSGDPSPSAALLPSVTPVPVVSEAPAAAVEPAPVEAAPEPAPAETSVEAAAEPAAAEAPVAEAAAEQAVAETTSAPEATAEPLPQAKRHRPKLLQRKPNPRRRPSLCSSKSGGPAAVRTNAARITIATASVIMAPARAARRQPQPARVPRARRASSSATVVGRRNNEFRKPREGAPADAAAAPAAEGAAPPRRARRPVRIAPLASVSKARAAIATTTIAATNSIATRATATRAATAARATRAAISADATRAAVTSATSGPSHRQWATSASPRERDRPADPNSPFAKLAALKEQLAGRKE